MHPRLLDRVPEPEADNRSLELAHLCTGSGTWRGSGSTGAGTSTSRSVSRLMSSPIVHLLSSPEQMWWVRQAPCRSHPEMIYADWRRFHVHVAVEHVAGVVLGLDPSQPPVLGAVGSAHALILVVGHEVHVTAAAARGVRQQVVPEAARPRAIRLQQLGR